MAVSGAWANTRHPFLDGKLKKMLIGGQWVEAVSGKTFESINPATGQVLATVAEGDAVDIDRAVAVPFGGYKMSGYGRESGIQQMDEYLNTKAVWIKTD